MRVGKRCPARLSAYVHLDERFDGVELEERFDTAMNSVIATYPSQVRLFIFAYRDGSTN